MNRILTLSILAAAILATGCTRIETGEVGVRVGFDKQVKAGELEPGSFNQVLIGDVLTFPYKDVNVVLVRTALGWREDVFPRCRNKRYWS